MRMPEKVAAFANFLGISEDAIHGSRRAVINPLVEQCGVDLGGGLVHEAWRIEHSEEVMPLILAEGTRRGPTGCRCTADTRRLLTAVEAGPGYAQGPASGRDPHGGGKFRDGDRKSLPLVVEGFQGDPQHLGSFFLNIQDQLSLSQPRLQACVLAFELSDPRRLVFVWLGRAFFGGRVVEETLACTLPAANCPSRKNTATSRRNKALNLTDCGAGIGLA